MDVRYAKRMAARPRARMRYSERTTVTDVRKGSSSGAVGRPRNEDVTRYAAHCGKMSRAGTDWGLVGAFLRAVRVRGSGTVTTARHAVAFAEYQTYVCSTP